MGLLERIQQSLFFWNSVYKMHDLYSSVDQLIENRGKRQMWPVKCHLGHKHQSQTKTFT